MRTCGQSRCLCSLFYVFLSSFAVILFRDNSRDDLSICSTSDESKQGTKTRRYLPFWMCNSSCTLAVCLGRAQKPNVIARVRSYRYALLTFRSRLAVASDRFNSGMAMVFNGPLTGRRWPRLKNSAASGARLAERRCLAVSPLKKMHSDAGSSCR